MKTLGATYCVYAIFILFFPIGNFQQSPIDECSVRSTCGECIQEKDCAWCMKDFVEHNEPRCFRSSSEHSCPREYYYNPNNEQTVIKNIPVSGSHSLNINLDSSSNSYPEMVHLAPQHIALKLRKGQTTSFELEYSQENFPMDVYYLIDGSLSMRKEKDKLIKLGNDLVDTLRKTTTKFKVGLGMFLNGKDQHNLENLTIPYSFKNVMALSTDTEAFSRAVSDAVDSIAIDAAKGTLDALLQAIVCAKEITWRPDARRIIILATNNELPTNITVSDSLRPHDGYCHMDALNGYTHSNILDFPTIAQIKKAVYEYGTNIIFAVDEQRSDAYEQLSHHIEGSSVGILSEDLANISELVLQQYHRITSSVEIKDSASTNLEVNRYSGCLDPPDHLLPTNRCSGLRTGDTVKFLVEVTLKECPANKKFWFEKFQIYAVGIIDSLIVDVELLCGCTFENDPEPKSALKRSLRTCPLGYYGEKCECQGENDTLGCRHDNTTLVDCSGRGSCICNACACELRHNLDEVISGKYCECDNFSCDRRNGLLCSGPNRGICQCGQCLCMPGYSGYDCGCQHSDETCRPTNDGEICSGHGECVCGNCRCYVSPEGRYSGKYCQKCPTCSGSCQHLKPCVQCQMYRTGPLSQTQCAENCKEDPVPISVESLYINDDESHCMFYDENDCRFEFKYSEDDDGKQIIHALESLVCPIST